MPARITRTWLLVLFWIVLPTLFVGCGEESGQAGASSQGAANTAKDPDELVFAFAKQSKPEEIQANADKLAAILSKELGVPVRAQVPTSYGVVVQAMVSGTADVAYFDSLAFLLAKRDGGAEILLAELRPDANGVERTNYDSIFVVRADSDLNSIEDIVKRASELRIAFTSPTSTSGYLMAMRRLVQEGLLKPGEDPVNKFAGVSFGGGYTQALEQVRDGRADVCAVSFYTMEGPRADVYIKDPADRAKLKIIARTPAVPTHVVAVRGELSSELKAKIKAALLKVSQENPELLADVYGASRLTEVDPEEHIKATVEAMQYIGRPVDEFVK